MCPLMIKQAAGLQPTGEAAHADGVRRGLDPAVAGDVDVGRGRAAACGTYNQESHQERACVLDRHCSDRCIVGLQHVCVRNPANFAPDLTNLPSTCPCALSEHVQMTSWSESVSPAHFAAAHSHKYGSQRSGPDLGDRLHARCPRPERHRAHDHSHRQWRVAAAVGHSHGTTARGLSQAPRGLQPQALSQCYTAASGTSCFVPVPVVIRRHTCALRLSDRLAAARTSLACTGSEPGRWRRAGVCAGVQHTEAGLRRAAECVRHGLVHPLSAEQGDPQLPRMPACQPRARPACWLEDQRGQLPTLQRAALAAFMRCWPQTAAARCSSASPPARAPQEYGSTGSVAVTTASLNVYPDSEYNSTTGAYKRIGYQFSQGLTISIRCPPCAAAAVRHAGCPVQPKPRASSSHPPRMRRLGHRLQHQLRTSVRWNPALPWCMPARRAPRQEPTLGHAGPPLHGEGSLGTLRA